MKNYKSADMIFRRMENDPGQSFTGAFYRNPMLVTAAGANLVAGGCITLSNGIVMSLLLMVLLPLAGLAAALKDRPRPTESGRVQYDDPGRSERTRPALYAIACAGIMLALALACNAVSRGSADALGVFLPLTALDTLVFVRLVKNSPEMTAGEGLAAGAGTACSFALIALPIAFVRGLIGGGIFAGRQAFDGVSALQSPFFGFILCGAAVAVFKRFAIVGAPDREDDEE